MCGEIGSRKAHCAVVLVFNRRLQYRIDTVQAGLTIHGIENRVRKKSCLVSCFSAPASMRNVASWRVSRDFQPG